MCNAGKSYSRSILLFWLVALAFLFACQPATESPSASPAATGAASAAPDLSWLKDLEPEKPNPYFVTVSRVEDLPLDYRYSDDEWADFMRRAKVEPEKPIDVQNSEVLTCERCAMVVLGVLLFPPFYLETTEDAVYINGYKYYPRSAGSFPLPLAAREYNQQEWRRRFGSYDEEMEISCQRKSTDISSEFLHIVMRTEKIKNAEERKKTIHTLVSRVATIEEISYSDEGVEFAYRVAGCPETYHYGYAFSSFSLFSSPPQLNPLSEQENWLLIKSGELRRGFMDNAISLIWGGSGNTRPINYLKTIFYLLAEEKDERIIYYELHKNYQIFSEITIYLLANNKRNLRLLRGYL